VRGALFLRTHHCVSPPFARSTILCASATPALAPPAAGAKDNRGVNVVLSSGNSKGCQRERQKGGKEHQREDKRSGLGSAGKGGFKYNLDIDFFLPNGMVPQGTATGAECCEVGQQQSADGGGGNGGRDRQEGQGKAAGVLLQAKLGQCRDRYAGKTIGTPRTHPPSRVLCRPHDLLSPFLQPLLLQLLSSKAVFVQAYKPRGQLRNNRVG